MPGVLPRDASPAARIALGTALLALLGCRNSLAAVTSPDQKCGVLWTDPITPPERVWLPTAASDAFSISIHYAERERSASECGISVRATDPRIVDVSEATGEAGSIGVDLTGMQPGGATVLVSLGAAPQWNIDVAVTDSQTLSRAIAHRGAGLHAPENSMAAMRLSARFPVPGVEFDVRLTGDSVPILMHDSTFARTTGYPGAVAETPFAISQTLNAVRYSAYPLPAEPPPALAGVLRFLGGTDIPLVLAEIKHQDAFPAPEEAARFLDAARGSGVGERLVIFSATVNVLTALRAQDSTVRLGFSAPRLLSTQRAFLAEHRIQFMLYPLTVFTPENRAALDQLRADGVQLVAYTTSGLAQADSFARAQPGVVILADSVPALFAMPPAAMSATSGSQ